MDSAGKITASATQTAGYVAAGTKSATKQLTTKAATTITPGTSNQTAVAAGVYTTGAITVKGDSNLKAENIKYGVSIFGVTGSATTTAKPSFIYDGDYSVVDDGNGNWRIKFLTSGTFKPMANTVVDVFLVGGGGGGADRSTTKSGGGGGGRTATRTGITLVANTSYTITIGAGGAVTKQGGTTSAFNASVTGGDPGSGWKGGNGGSGGGGATDSGAGAAGGTNGGNGSSGSNGGGGSGQGTTTREFGESSGTQYSGGGGGGGSSNGGAGGDRGGGRGSYYKTAPIAGTVNTGGGGGGGSSGGGWSYVGASGGSGIVIIRNAR